MTFGAWSYRSLNAATMVGGPRTLWGDRGVRDQKKVVKVKIYVILRFLQQISGAKVWGV